MKKRKVVILISIIILLLLAAGLVYNFDKFYESENKVQIAKNNIVDNSNIISLMIETGVNTNKYNASDSNEWPGNFYEINKEKSGCENGGTLTYNTKTQQIALKQNVSDKCYVYFDRVTLNFSNHIKSLYTGKGDNNIYYHNATLALSAQDNSYRYSGTTSQVKNNYVCFGSTTNPCPDDNLYRILGVIDNSVRVIKYVGLGNDSADSKMAWDENGNKVWATSTLNAYLNGTFLTNLGTWANQIKTSTWYSGEYRGEVTDYDNDSSMTAKDFYDKERTATTNSAKVGLLSASDYGFTASPSNWGRKNSMYFGPHYYFYYDVWLGATGTNEWMLNPIIWGYGASDDFMDADEGILILSIGSSNVNKKPCLDFISSKYTNGKLKVKPVFNLVTNAEIKDGDGTKTNPYIINI